MSERITHPQLEREARYNEKIRTYARTAEQLETTYTWPHNIWTAARNEQGADRTRIFSDVLRELKRMKKDRIKTDKGNGDHQLMQVSKNAKLIQGAYANERSHPRDAWDNFYDAD